jgi:predicted dehydrogenase
MVKVGVIGLGMMGNTHLDAYAKRKDVQVVAVSDLNPERLSGKQKAAGNVEGQAKGSFDLQAPGLKRYAEGSDLIADPNVELVDICLQTPQHAEYGIKALQAGKHVLLEKPVVRHHSEAAALLAAAKKAKGFVMVAQCMRFWPGWTWLKDAVSKGTYGRVLAAHFRRVAAHPGGPFYSNGKACGGAILDLHIHDTDFVQFLFGMPKSVSSAGYSKPTESIDHVLTRYDYGSGGPLVFAEGGWAMAPGFGFSMTYTVNFQNATAVFDLARGAKPLRLIVAGQEPKDLDLDPGMGYDYEIAYFVDCIQKKQAPSVVTLDDAVRSVQIVEAEVASVQKGGAPVAL